MIVLRPISTGITFRLGFTTKSLDLRKFTCKKLNLCASCS
ncbi:hypothetical protein PBPMD00_38 [Pinkberry virus LS07-2018-MD00]|nr:hypothetical protein PBPMD00_38 [Pinkberry virus LS07-2018-MD00]